MTRGGKREGAGRKQLFEKTTIATTRISTETWEKIPSPKADFIRKAIDEKIKQQGSVK